MATAREAMLQDKREALILLREKDKRAEKPVSSMLESEIDKEIAWRMDPARFETSDTVLKTIYSMLKRLTEVRFTNDNSEGKNAKISKQSANSKKDVSSV